ncbi:MAG: hypothetical protein Q8P46_05225 [Hyphomicrobiales bacterium]|nr:hypothetical protein [Hyphomicrobiales bacterium]
MRVLIAVALAAGASLSLVSTGPSQAAPNKFGQRVSDCSKWDCSGGIICSCCFENGCWICDAHFGKPSSFTEKCEWNDAVRNQGTVPGGGIFPAAVCSILAADIQ